MAVYRLTRIYSEKSDKRRKLFALPNEGVDLDGSNSNKTGMILGAGAGLSGAYAWNNKHLLSGEGAALVKTAKEANAAQKTALTAFKKSPTEFIRKQNLITANTNATAAKNSLQAFNKANRPGMMTKMGRGAALLGAGMLVGNMLFGGNKNKDN